MEVERQGQGRRSARLLGAGGGNGPAEGSNTHGHEEAGIYATTILGRCRCMSGGQSTRAPTSLGDPYANRFTQAPRAPCMGPIKAFLTPVRAHLKC